MASSEGSGEHSGVARSSGEDSENVLPLDQWERARSILLALRKRKNEEHLTNDEMREIFASEISNLPEELKADDRFLRILREQYDAIIAPIGTPDEIAAAEAGEEGSEEALSENVEVSRDLSPRELIAQSRGELNERFKNERVLVPGTTRPSWYDAEHDTMWVISPMGSKYEIAVGGINDFGRRGSPLRKKWLGRANGGWVDAEQATPATEASEQEAARLREELALREAQLAREEEARAAAARNATVATPAQQPPPLPASISPQPAQPQSPAASQASILPPRIRPARQQPQAPVVPQTPPVPPRVRRSSRLPQTPPAAGGADPRISAQQATLPVWRDVRPDNQRPVVNARRNIFRRIVDFFRRRPEPEVPSELRTWISEATTEREMTHRFAVARRALSDLREINVNEGSRIRDYADIQMKLNSKNREYARGMARSVLLGLAVATVAGAVVSGGSIPTLAILGKVACSSVVSYVTTKQLNQYLEKKKVRGAWAYSAVAGLAAGIATGDLYSYLNGTSGLFVGGNTGTPERFAAIPSENPAQNAIDPAHRPELRMPEFPPAADSVASGSIVSPPTTPQGITLVPGIHVDPPIAPGEKIVSIPEFDPGRVRAVLETMPNTADTATYMDGKMQLSDGFIANNFTYQFPQEYVVKAGDAVATKGIDGFLQTQILNTEGFKSLGLSKLAELQFIDAIRTVAINNPEYAEKLGARIVNGDLVYKAGDVIQASLIGKPDFVKDLLDTIATRESVLSRELIAKLGTLDHFGLELGRGVRA